MRAGISMTSDKMSYSTNTRTARWKILDRFVSAFERIADAFETSVINQNKIVEQTVKTMKMATDLDPTQGPSPY